MSGSSSLDMNSVITLRKILRINRSYKKQCLLLIKIDKLTFFIYKPKPLEVPRLALFDRV